MRAVRRSGAFPKGYRNGRRGVQLIEPSMIYICVTPDLNNIRLFFEASHFRGARAVLDNSRFVVSLTESLQDGVCLGRITILNRTMQGMSKNKSFAKHPRRSLRVVAILQTFIVEQSFLWRVEDPREIRSGLWNAGFVILVRTTLSATAARNKRIVDDLSRRERK